VKTTLTEGPLASIKDMSNKEIKIQFIKHNFQKPYVHIFWKRYFDIETDWQQLYHFLNYILIDNRVKQFRFKLIHRIIATKENLFTWKISDTPLCNSCGDIDTVEHFLLHCKHRQPMG